MPCNLCNQDLSGALMTLPCCQNVVHTVCGIRSIGDQLADRYNANCASCEALQYLLASPYDVGVAHALPEAPAFVEAVKSCNKFRITAMKARVQFRKLLREKKVVFSEQVAQHIQAIKAIKKAEMTSIKSSDVFKAYNKGQNAYSRSFARILKDFNINTFSLRRQLRLRLKDECRMWQYSGHRMIARLFRMRL
jgi:hypothetical protein